MLDGQETCVCEGNKKEVVINWKLKQTIRNCFLIKFYVAKPQRTSKSIQKQRMYGRQS